MKKALLLFSLLVVLAAPAMAAPRDDDPHGPGGMVSRVVHFIKRLLVPMDLDPVVTPPKP